MGTEGHEMAMHVESFNSDHYEVDEFPSLKEVYLDAGERKREAENNLWVSRPE